MFKFREFNWTIVLIWLSLVVIGLVAIYSATQGPVAQFLPAFIQDNFFKQVIYVVMGVVIIAGMQLLSPRLFKEGAYLFYIIGLFLMVITLLFGTEINGAKSWLDLGFFNLQTSELMKIATILATASYLTSQRNISAENFKHALVTVTLILVPAILVIMQNDVGTALVFLSLIPIMLFWSGLPQGVSLFIISPAIVVYTGIIGWQWGVLSAIILTVLIFMLQKRNWLTLATFLCSIILVIGVQVGLNKVLQPHQRARIISFTNPQFDPQGAGWNVIQAKTAIGSGGIWGKGYMQGTQTQLRFLPEQWTDFIYCVIAEEFGFVGASVVLVLFMLLFLNLLKIAREHKNSFAQIIIVGVTWVFFIHFLINIGSTMGLIPIVGLPLPFVSYGGSSMIANSLMLAICLNLDYFKRKLSIYL